MWSFKNAEKLLSKIKTENNNQGFGVLRLFKCLLLQFMENLSDRDLAKYLTENVSGKWFCGFDLAEATPDFTVFTKFRARVGTNLISKAKLWEERDKALALR